MTDHPGRRIFTLALLAAALGCSGLPVAADGIDAPAVRTDLTPAQLKRVQAVTRPTTDFSRAETYETMESGAGTSTAAVNDQAFSQPPTNLDPARALDFHLGNALFRQLWVSSPSSTQATDGLGPLFNARSCQSCHINDGRGHPPETSGRAATMFLRLARPARTAEERQALADARVVNFPDATYGTQLQDTAVPGLAGEGQVAVDYTEHAVTLAGGETVSLRQPRYSATDLAYGPLGPDTTLSARVAPAMLGLGLIEAIPDADILEHADPDDRDHDGIAGKAAIVRDNRTGKLALGRFGWKAQNATVRDQSSAALEGDIGISNPDRPNAYGDCTAREPQCLAMPDGVQKRLGPTEAPEAVLDLMTFYSENLAVPARRKPSDPTVLHGKEMFYESGCIACHTPKFVTRSDAGTEAQSFQLIWPYSDFLLHDMGDGLADGQPVGVASGKDWRTPPLWGIGLTKTVSGHTFFLHDGRARSLTEAILWHGGEATKARDAFASLSKDDRQALITFVESL
ncbi:MULTISPECIES: di-heme oxidoreductase family protein [unclassified Rhizobium]|uniref:di-heme oxidoreductase family protein n=1 Tax=unclassified Rhizobium TaxID=2613769 RepID=UPI001ADD387E|nr:MULTISPECIES: di-heme oxidoredictase family protein [unclassified Rhizobium]MBO9096928.1 c-type cytochrome [Rhizobium sp. L58/93]MBO9134231.1 c-type cytochrome [Rhizobium sp. B209b/85]MBO9167167.1 c-type cytochrome [Rhizobium sp. L245/93]MBO9183125.1 c-type cytochrome [Rhizobium sp. E27B/91]QXZ85908.1 c-type cytochrome [Rhizobium sp. K1/93]